MVCGGALRSTKEKQDQKEHEQANIARQHAQVECDRVPFGPNQITCVQQFGR